MTTQDLVLAGVPTVFNVDDFNTITTLKNTALPPATATSLGAIKVGAGLTVTADGTLSGGGIPTLQSVLTSGRGANAAASNNLTLFNDLGYPFIFSNLSTQITVGSSRSSILFYNDVNGNIRLGAGTNSVLVNSGGGLTCQTLTMAGSGYNTQFIALSNGFGISTSANNIPIALAPNGRGLVVLGNIATYTGISILGGQTAYAQITTAGGGQEIDLVLAPSGNLYPIGRTLNSLALVQPQVFFAQSAGSANLSQGAAGQVLTSNGTSGAPYWANTSGAVTIVTYSGTVAGAQVLPITSQVNTLGLTIGTSTIGGFVTGGVYKVELHNSLTQTSGTSSTFNSYFALSTGGQITTLASYGNGIAISNIKPNTNPPNGDYLTSAGFGFMTGTGNLTMTSYVQGVSGVAVSYNGWAIITRIS